MELFRDEPNSGFNNNRDRINYFIKDSESFNYKISITGKLENDDVNFWRTLNIPLINCEVYLDLT